MDYNINQINELIKHVQNLTEELEIVDEILEALDVDALEDSLLTEEEKKKWIQKAIKKEGALHKSLKVKKGEKIPAGKLEKASHKGGKLGKRARLALTLRKMKHGKKKEELKEDMDMAAMHANITDNLKANAKKMPKDELQKHLNQVAAIEQKLGTQPKVGYQPWLTVSGEY